MKKIYVLGAGMVGSLIAFYCSKFQDAEVTSADINPDNLKKIKNKISQIKTVTADLSDASTIKKLVSDADIVISAVPGFMGYQTLKAIIDAGKNCVDISFFPEDPFELHEAAVNKGVKAVVDCGVAPGFSNMILGYFNKNNTVKSFECCVGGLPLTRTLPWQYKAPFSPVDVLEEYTRPARYIKNHELVSVDPFAHIEQVESSYAGTLDAFISDGLRTLITTQKVPDMVEKTLRYPGHVQLVKVLKDSGFLSKEPVSVKGADVAPIELTSALLFKEWKLNDDDPEMTYLFANVEFNDGRRTRVELFDERDYETGFSSMARTTGLTCVAATLLMLTGRIEGEGIIPPETLASQKGNFRMVVRYLQSKGIYLTKRRF
ncbi:MAG: saccharopine dehydrogenase NADP-binding domain-containing protein [Ignavibacteriaceae bacterium]|nr:saccharopine dehydrogenase NADP-binding domain-containing protein [Ignavibacteriaceae bacterium]